MHYRIKWTDRQGNKQLSGLMKLKDAVLLKHNLMLKPSHNNITIIHDDDSQNIYIEHDPPFNNIRLLNMINNTVTQDYIERTTINSKELKDINFSHHYLHNIDFSGLKIINCNFKHAYLLNCDFSYTDCHECFFYNSTITFCDFSHSKIYNSNFKFSILKTSKFRTTIMYNCNITGSDAKRIGAIIRDKEGFTE